MPTHWVASSQSSGELPEHGHSSQRWLPCHSQGCIADRQPDLGGHIISLLFVCTLSFYFYFIFFIFYCYSITVVCLFSPSLHPTPVELPSLPHLHPPPWFCPRVLYSSSCNPLSSLFPPHFPLAIVRLFLPSMSLVICCFLFSSTYYVPVKGEIIWYLSLTTWLISLKIMLSSSIHAVAKGISSFFLSAA